MKNELLAFVQSEKNIALAFVEQAKGFSGDIYLYGAGKRASGKPLPAGSRSSAWLPLKWSFI